MTTAAWPSCWWPSCWWPSQLERSAVLADRENDHAGAMPEKGAGGGETPLTGEVAHQGGQSGHPCFLPVTLLRRSRWPSGDPGPGKPPPPPPPVPRTYGQVRVTPGDKARRCSPIRFASAPISLSAASDSSRPDARARRPERLRPRPRFCCCARSSSIRIRASLRASSSTGLRQAGR